MKGLFTSLAISSSLILAGCELSEEEKEQLEKAGENLEQLADQIIITYPAKNSTVKNSIVTVRADVPEELNATKVSLFVDGIEIAYDDNGAPWEIEWPAYYWADDNNHSLLLKTTTESGSQVRNNESYQVEVSSEANDMLGFSGNLDGKQLQDTDELAISFNEVPYATRYEVKYGDKTNSETGTATLLKNLQVGNYQLVYRALYDFSESTTLKGAWSESVAIEVLPPEIPVITGPVIGENEKGFTATFTWDSGNVEDKLTFKAVNNSSHQPVIVDVNADKGAAMIEGLDVGEFSWSVELENSYSHKNESEVKNFQINEIAAPVVYEPVKGYTETGHTLEFSWEPVAATDKYSVLVKGFPNENSFVEYESADLTKLLVGELGFGEHEWKIKRTTISGRTVDSDLRNTHILEPAIKREFTSTVNKEETSGYRVSFSGDENMLAGSTYEIGLKLDSGPEIFEGCAASCSFSEQKIGNYSYRIKRTNPIGQLSYSESISLDVGVFKTQLGGSRGEAGYQIIASKTGGYLVRARTSSYEVTETLTGAADDWIIRLNEKGEVIAQYVDNIDGWSRFTDFIETTDGSIYLVGRDFNVGIIIKLDSNLIPVWDSELRYKPEDTTLRYDFSSIIEWNNRLFVAGVEWIQTTDGGTRRFTSRLHEVDTEKGVISSVSYTPSIDGIITGQIEKMMVSKEGFLVLLGNAFIGQGYSNEQGIYMVVLGNELETISDWHNVAEFRQITINDAIFYSSEKLVTTGQTDYGDLSISILNLDGTSQHYYQADYDDWLSSAADMYLSKDNTIMVLTQDFKDGRQFVVKEFNQSLRPLNLFEVGAVGSDIIGLLDSVYQEDSSLTLLLSKEDPMIKTRDIVVQKIGLPSQ